MSLPEEQWWSVRAAEYVLGTLNGEDYKLFAKILDHDEQLQQEVARWEQRLSALNESTEPVTPDARVWNNIRDAIDIEQNHGPVAYAPSDKYQTNNTGLDVSESAHVRAVQDSDDRAIFWAGIATLTTAASLLMGYLFFQGTLANKLKPFDTDGIAVVLSDEGGVPYFLVETDYASSKVRVTTISPPPLTDADVFQLWQAVPDRTSVKAITRLPHELGATIILEAAPLIDGSDLFGVSIEAAEANALEGPQGPVVAHGDYLRTTKAD